MLTEAIEQSSAAFITSDTHFGHKNIITYCSRPFYSVQQMDYMMLQNFQQVLQEDTLLIHLGDVAMGRIEDSLGIVSQIPGRKLLIPGNHDRVSSIESTTKQKRFRPLYEAAGFEILPEEVTTVIDGISLIFNHYPPEDGNDVREVEKRRADKFRKLRPTEKKNAMIVHGHNHQLDNSGKWVHVGVDSRDFRPVPIADVIAEAKKKM